MVKSALISVHDFGFLEPELDDKIYVFFFVQIALVYNKLFIYLLQFL